jgi:hypothetical protein
MNLNCLLHGHTYEKIGTRWINNMQDEYQATNIGGMIKSYEYEIYRCTRCLKEKLIYTGKDKFI